MISLVVTADSDTKNYNLAERDKAFSEAMAQFNEPFEIVYTICDDYGFKNELKRIVSGQKNKQLVISAPATNTNTLIYTALDFTNNGDVLLCTMDTNPEVITKILKQHFDGADIVFTKQKENWFKSIFTSLGRTTYQLGLRFLGRGQDIGCDARVIYLNARSVNTIILNPTLSKALRLVNPDPERHYRVVTTEKIYENPTLEQKQTNRSFFALGIVSMFFFLALIAMALVFPFFNDGTYTGIVLVGVIVWLVFGILICVVSARQIYKTRLGYPVALNLQKEPVIKVVEYVSYNSEIAKQFSEDENEEIEMNHTSAMDILKQKAAEQEILKNELEHKQEVTEEVKAEIKEEPAQKEEKQEKPKKTTKTTSTKTTSAKEPKKTTTKTTSTKKSTTTKKTTTATTKKTTKPVISKIDGKKTAKTKK